MENTDKSLLQLLLSPTGLFVTFGSLIGFAAFFLFGKGNVVQSENVKKDLLSEEEKEVKQKPTSKTSAIKKKK